MIALSSCIHRTDPLQPVRQTLPSAPLLRSPVSPPTQLQRSHPRQQALYGSQRRQRNAGCSRGTCRATAQQGGLSYKDAGVDIDAGNELVRRIRKLNPAIGGFSGAYEFGDSYLVAGTDGVGTKLKLAFELNRHDTIGIDLVAMSVNDIITSGAKPMFFLDYFATGALDVDTAEDVVKGIVAGCQESDCILMGGETAEMPGMYTAGEYDLAGFAVGSVKKEAMIDGSGIAAGDAVLALPSSGIHSNGFSLVRKILQVSGTQLTDRVPWGEGTFGDALLAPTVLYVRPVLKLLQQLPVKGLIHMTGGGFPENIPRVVPKGLQTRVDCSAWDIPELFKWLQQAGGVSDEEMFRTFNMGVGMVIVVAPQDAEAVLAAGVGAFRLGDIAEGDGVQMLDSL